MVIIFDLNFLSVRGIFVFSLGRDLPNDPIPKTLVVLALTALVMFGNPAIALMVGMTISLFLNRAPIANGSTYGKHLLQTAIVLLGLKLNATELLDISSTYAMPVATFVCITLIVGLLSGWLARSDRTTNALISSGTAICGGTTIATLSPILTARPEQTGAALCVVFLLSAIALMTFPSIGAWLNLSQEQFGVWAALAIHDTSSVVAAAQMYGTEAAEIATTIKMGRTLWLIPLMIVASLVVGTQQSKIRIPNFIFVFITASVIGSWIGFSSSALTAIGHVVASLLVVALFFVGTEITRETLKSLAFTSVAHGVVLWLLVILAVLWGVTLWVP